MTFVGKARKIAIVTGGARGLGLALTRDLIRAGMRVCVLDLEETPLEITEEDWGLSLRCDVGDPASVREAVAACVAEYGCPDVLVNNAGLVRNGPLYNFLSRETDEEVEAAWRSVLEVNLNGPFYVTRAVVKHMLRSRVRGVVVNISSVCAAGNPGQGAYSASKAALEAATAAWAAELGPLGIRVAAVAPGYASTETTLQTVAPGVLEGIVKKTPLKRLGTPQEIVKAVRFVIDTDFFSGRVLQIDGGLRI